LPRIRRCCRLYLLIDLIKDLGVLLIVELLLLLTLRLCLLHLLLDDLLIVVHVGRRRTVRKVTELLLLLRRRGRGRVRDYLSHIRQNLSAWNPKARHDNPTNGGSNTDGLAGNPVGLLVAVAAVVGRHVVARLLTRRQHATAVFDCSWNVERNLFILLKQFLDDLVGLDAAVDALTILEAIFDHLLDGAILLALK